MGTKVLIVAAILGLIATSGHAFAAQTPMTDGLKKSGLLLTLRKTSSIRLSPPKAPAPVVIPTLPPSIG